MKHCYKLVDRNSLAVFVIIKKRRVFASTFKVTLALVYIFINMIAKSSMEASLLRLFFKDPSL